MKTLFIFLTTLCFVVSCQTKQFSKTSNNTSPEISTSENDSIQYELIIIDTKFETFLATQPPMNFYSQQYYETWNTQYVTEWNIRHGNPMRYGDFYETHIDYDQATDYGLDLNYRLYYYFLFIEKEYGITLIKRAKTR